MLGEDGGSQFTSTSSGEEKVAVTLRGADGGCGGGMVVGTGVVVTTGAPIVTGVVLDEYVPIPFAFTAASLNTNVPLLSDDTVAVVAGDVGSLNTVQLVPLFEEYDRT